MKRSSDQIFDELLVLKCQEKDREAAALLWKRWQPKVLRWSYGFLKDKDLAADVAQESWVSIFEQINKLRDPVLFPYWLYRIVQRRAVDQIRTLQKERKVTEVLASEQKGLALLGEVKYADDPVEKMLNCIKELPLAHQQIIKLHYLDRESVEDIAAITDLPIGTIKSRLFYARKYLKEKMKEVYHE